jgi:glutathione S-transferase
MYAPVASRLRTYIPQLATYGDDGGGLAYVETIFAMAEMADWTEGAKIQTAAAG